MSLPIAAPTLPARLTTLADPRLGKTGVLWYCSGRAFASHLGRSTTAAMWEVNRALNTSQAMVYQT